MSLPPALLTELAPYGRYGIETKAPLAPHTSFRIGGPAEALLTVTRLSHLLSALETLWRWQTPFLLLGGGSNVLISDAGVPGLVILNQCRHIIWPASTDATLLVRAESGAALAGLARAAIKHQMAGLAWAVSVPGTIGGAVVGNAGAHSGCIADNLVSIELWQNGRAQTVAADQLELTYRHSRLKTSTDKTAVVLTATFRLEPDPHSEDAARAERFIEHRRRTQPVDKSAGSIFKNPPRELTPFSSGYLIEAAGLKGYTIGGASVSTLHANFIINHGHATANDVLRLMNHIRGVVHEHSGILLEPEIQLLGEWPGPSPSSGQAPSPSSAQAL